MFKRIVGSAVLLANAASCAPAIPHDLQSLRILTTSEGNYLSSHLAARRSFPSEEGIVIAAQIGWSEPEIYGGVHEATWLLYRDGLLLTRKTSDEKLVGKPTWVGSHIGGGSFPPGSYHVELQMDNQPFASTSFQFVASPPPALLAAPITGPNCAGVPRSEIKALRFGHPAPPPRELDVKGCGVASIVLGADGTPAGVRVAAEYPPGSGFGDAVAQAAWQTVYPAGHAGATVYLSVHFNPVS